MVNVMSEMIEMNANIKRINKELVNLGTYHKNIPVDKIFAVLALHEVVVLQEDGTPFQGFFCGEQGRVGLDIKMQYHPFPIKNKRLQVSWYKMQSGNFEVIAYVG